MNIDCMLYLQGKGLLTAEKHKMLDIGPQNVYFATVPQISKLVSQQGPRSDGGLQGEALQKEIERISYFCTPRPEERTTLFSEIADLTNIEYNAFDVCPAPRTEILDLNFDTLPYYYKNYYDVVLNFGTTEHVFNQWNSFELMHDACSVGGVIYCVLPMSGYLDHGYYCYTPLFFEDMAKANGYEMIDLFIAQAGLNNVNEMNLDIRKEHKFDEPKSGVLIEADARVPNFNIHAVMKKTSNRSFSATLEVATAHSAVDEGIASRYGGGARGKDGEPAAGSPVARNETATGPGGTRTELDMRIAERDRFRTERDEFERQNRRLAGEVVGRIRERDQYLTERDEANRKIEEAAAKVSAVYASRSWRITAPLRAIVRSFSK